MQKHHIYSNATWSKILDTLFEFRIIHKCLTKKTHYNITKYLWKCDTPRNNQKSTYLRFLRNWYTSIQNFILHIIIKVHCFIFQNSNILNNRYIHELTSTQKFNAMFVQFETNLKAWFSDTSYFIMWNYIINYNKLMIRI